MSSGKSAHAGHADVDGRVALRLGRRHLRSQLLLQLLELLLGVGLGPLGPSEDLLLDAVLAVDLVQQLEIRYLS